MKDEGRMMMDQSPGMTVEGGAGNGSGPGYV